jgi:hypothetical protein
MKPGLLKLCIVIILLTARYEIFAQQPVAMGIPFTNTSNTGYKIIPTFREGDSLIIAYLSEDRQSVGYAIKNSSLPNLWETHHLLSRTWPFPDPAELIFGNHNERYVFEGYNYSSIWYMPDSTGQPQYIPCPSRPVIDNYGNLHVIWQDNTGVYYYGMSADTLRTFQVLDTLVGFSGFRKIAVSPDNSLLAAVFRQDNVFIKYYSMPGGAIDFNSPITIQCPTDVYRYAANRDLAIDYSGRLYTIYSGGGSSQWEWGFHFAWAENNTPVFLDSAYDDIVNGTYFEIIFNQSGENSIILENSGLGNSTRFFVGIDNGITWIGSHFNFNHEDRPFLCSPRSYSDTVDFFYYQSGYLIYEVIPAFMITDDLAINSGQLALPEYFGISAYPNPFNAQTTISFTLAQAGQANIAIYDIAGRLVEKIADKKFPAGENRVIWDASGKPSGVYFVRLSNSNLRSISKLLMLK